MSKRTKYAVESDQGTSIWEKEEGADLKHNYFMRELYKRISDELDPKFGFAGPRREGVYPRDFPEAEGDYEEGEFDVYLELPGKILVYEIKNGGKYCIEKALGQYQKAQNFVSLLDKDLDFNIVLVSEDFDAINQALDGARTELEGVDDISAVDAEHIEEELDSHYVGNLIKSGILSKFEWLESGYRDTLEAAPRFDFDSLEEQNLIGQEEHIYVARRRLLDALEDKNEERVLHLSPFWDNFYGEDQVDRLLEDTIEDL